MKILIDIQGAQSTGSRTRGIGKYTTSFIDAVIRNANEHQIALLVSSLFPETIPQLVKLFEDRLSLENIHVWQASGPASGLSSSILDRSAAELSREAFIASLHPDVVVVSSLIEGLTDDAVTSIGRIRSNFPIAVVHYDLIPYIYRKAYLSNDSVEAWYERKLKYLREANMLLCISEASRRDAVDLLRFTEDDAVNISSAVDDVFCRLDLSHDVIKKIKNDYLIFDEFILYTGGIDHRKNIDTLLRAYSKMPASIIEKHQLVIVCSIQAEARNNLLAVARDCGLSADRVVFTGFVPELDLISLYNMCALFVFPSFYEGFGLPVLEAMKCGATVVAANTSSIPEILPFSEALFDPISADSITNKLLLGLTDQDFRKRFSEVSTLQIKKFTWDKTAIRAIRALEELCSNTPRTSQDLYSHINKMKRPRLAYVSPLPPTQSGIADFSSELLPELARYYEIDVIVQQDNVLDPWARANAPFRTVAWLKDNADYYDRIIYHFGNSVFHSHMFELAQELPGVVVLHDFFLSGVLAHLQFSQMDGNAFSDELYYSHGYGALYQLHKSPAPAEIIYEYPCNFSVISQSRGIITHCQHALSLGTRFYPNCIPEMWDIIPLARDVPRLKTKLEARKRLGLSADEFVICCFGILGPTKLNDKIFRAWRALSGDKKGTVRLVFVGANQGGGFGEQLADDIKTFGLNLVGVSGWVDQETYRDYLAAADMGIQLRTLSRGETSAAVLDCLAAGLPTVVNANGSMAELPDDTVYKLPDDFSDDDLVEALRNMVADQQLRETLSTKGKAHLVHNHSTRVAAEKYFHAIERFYSDDNAIRFVLDREVANLPGEFQKERLIRYARAASLNFKPNAWQPQILVDVGKSLPTGALSIVLEKIKAGLRGMRIEPVYFDRNSDLRYARSFTFDRLGMGKTNLRDDLVDYYKGDVFFHNMGADNGGELDSRFRFLGVKTKSIYEVSRYLDSI